MWQIIENKEWAEIERTFTWVRDMNLVPQDPVRHAEGNVAIHTRMVLDALCNLEEFQALPLQERELLVAAALLHDVEKRSTTNREPSGRITARGHARLGARTAQNLLYQNVPTPFAYRETVVRLVRYHSLPLWIFDRPDSTRLLHRISQEVDTRLLALLCRADVLGRICPDRKELLYRLDLFEALCQEEECYGQAKAFPSGASRFFYFAGHGDGQYEPFRKEPFEVYLLCALPGAGKDTFVKERLRGLPMISLDRIRRSHKIRPGDRKRSGWVIQQGKQRARELLRAKTPFVWNATNLQLNPRKKLIDLFTAYGASVHVIYLEVAYAGLIARNRTRIHPVPAKALHKMLERWEVPACWEAQRLSLLYNDQQLRNF